MKKKDVKKKVGQAQKVAATSLPVFGDFGEDDAFATESHPEGLRYDEGPHAPGSLAHPATEKDERPPHGDISIG